MKSTGARSSKMSCSDLTRMNGYRHNSLSNGRQVTCSIWLRLQENAWIYGMFRRYGTHAVVHVTKLAKRIVVKRILISIHISMYLYTCIHMYIYIYIIFTYTWNKRQNEHILNYVIVTYFEGICSRHFISCDTFGILQSASFSSSYQVAHWNFSRAPIFRENCVNIMAVDALTPCVVRSSAAMVLIIKINASLSSTRKNIARKLLSLFTVLFFKIVFSQVAFLLLFSIAIFSPYFFLFALWLQSVALFQSKELDKYLESL